MRATAAFFGAIVVPFDLRVSTLLFDRSCHDKPITIAMGKSHNIIVLNF